MLVFGGQGLKRLNPEVNGRVNDVLRLTLDFQKPSLVSNQFKSLIGSQGISAATGSDLVTLIAVHPEDQARVMARASFPQPLLRVRAPGLADKCQADNSLTLILETELALSYLVEYLYTGRCLSFGGYD